MNMQLKSIENRNSNVELLRIISIFLITLSHWAVHSDFDFPTDHFTLNQLFVELSSIGELGVCIFVIISGYFSIKQKQTVRGFLNLFLKIWIYNICILGFTYFQGTRQLSLNDILKSIIPLYNLHWFAYAFLVLYIFMPYINLLAKNLKEKEFRILLILIFIGWSLIYTFTGADLSFSYLGWFIFLYMLGAYLRIYDIKLSTKRYILLLLISVFALILSCITINIIGLKMGFYPVHGTHLFSLHSPIILIIAISMFQMCSRRAPKYNTAVNLVASTSFGIYLISDNPLARNFIWNELFYNRQFSESHLLFGIGIAEVLIVMIFCVIIELFWRLISSSRIYDYSETLIEKIILKFRDIILSLEFH